MQIDTQTPNLQPQATNLRGTNPLAVIIVFVSLTEFVVGGSLILKAEGGILVALTTFVIAFPLIVAAAFFFVLWFRPAHLYAPQDHNSSQDFLKSLRVNSDLRQREIASQNDAYKNQLDTLRYELNRKLADGSGVKSSDISVAVTEAVDAAEKATSISVEMPDGKRSTYSLATIPTFGSLADQVFFDTGHIFRFSPYMYGQEWALNDIKSGRRIQHARIFTGIGPGVPVKDSRSLADVGILPGAELRLVLLNRVS